MMILATHARHPKTKNTWKRDEKIQAAFDQKDGWLGADGAYSLPLSPDKTLWAFSDTIQGHCDGDACTLKPEMAHNSLAMQTKDGFEFSPEQVFTPPDQRGWFWVYDGIKAPDNHCQLFLGQFESTQTGPEGFNFAFVDSWVADVQVGAHVADSKVTAYRKLSELLPGLRAPAGAALHFGAALCQDDSYEYVYGTQDFGFSKKLVLARVPLGRELNLLDEHNRWEVYDGKEWTNGANAEPILDPAGKPLEVSNELSVFRRDGKFWMVTQVGKEVRLLSSLQAEGPFEAAAPPQVVEEPGSGVFTYNGKAHEQDINEQGILVSYNRNALPFSELCAKPDLYRPQFFRMPLPV